MGGLVLSQPWGRNVSQTQCKTQSIPCALSSRQKGGMGAGCCSWWQLNPLPACLHFPGPFIQPPWSLGANSSNSAVDDGPTRACQPTIVLQRPLLRKKR